MSNRHVKKAKESVTIALRAGARVAGADPEKLAAELALIYRRKGILGAEDYVAEAADADSPLHQTLEWDDSVAGHQYRLQQARNIIRSVVIKRGDVDVRPVYVYVDNDRKYQPATVVVDEPEMYALALAALLRKTSAAREAVNQLMEVARESRGEDSELLARIGVAMQALHTADSAVRSLH